MASNPKLNRIPAAIQAVPAVLFSRLLALPPEIRIMEYDDLEQQDQIRLAFSSQHLLQFSQVAGVKAPADCPCDWHLDLLKHLEPLDAHKKPKRSREFFHDCQRWRLTKKSYWIKKVADPGDKMDFSEALNP